MISDQIKKLHASRLGRKIGIVFIVNWVNNVLKFLLGIYIVREFGADGKGTYFLIQSGGAVLAVLLSIGITNSLVFHLKKNLLSECRAIRILVLCGVLVALTTVVLQLMFGLTAWKFFVSKVPFNWKWGLIVTAYVPVIFYTLFLRSHLLANRKTTQYFALTSVSLTCVIAATLLISCYEHSSLEIVLLATVAIEALAAILIMGSVYLQGSSLAASRKDSCDTPSEASLREIISYGLRGHAGTVGTNLAMRIDAFILAGFTSTEIVGYYSVAKFFFEAMNSIPTAINGLLFGYFCDRTQEDALKLNKKISLVVGGVLLGLATIGYFVGGPFILLVYGPEFWPAILPLQILLASAVFLGFSSPYFPLFLSQGRPGTVSIVGVCTGAIRVSLTFLLVAQYSIVGAAVASTLTSMTTLLLCIYFRRKLNHSLEFPTIA